ncbi:MAG: phosphoribosylformylglycinamidine cyclo-ligase [Nitrospinota bacterium]|nr:phosphoribosylformylglycinamidine cyclo-ligase [Nitrospinota bacterium]MDP6619751.1 phosphoribosylformylglycinamidine cyclo-ligase [Nitrospinota bacterium]HJM43926.1 phosphoribosylformylglycinamidine cyclo-ligase [Nitrospinota bacterium]
MTGPGNPNRSASGLTYRRAGVDIEAAGALVPRLRGLAESTRRPEVEGTIGGFGGGFRIPPGFREPVLVAGMDGVGTKLDLLFRTGRHAAAGRDLVAMCVNDVLAQGAEPLFFLDYIATGRLDPGVAAEVVTGISEACVECGCALLGGETAEMPDFYPGERYDLAGCAVGIVERDQVIDGKKIRPGDVLLGLASSGPHSNGFSLIRRILEEKDLSLDAPLPGAGGRTLAEVLLAPTRLYVRSVLDALREIPVAGIAHITGGGIAGNLARVLPEDCRAVVRNGDWPVPPVFGALQSAGDIDAREMETVFNLGIGLIVVVSPSDGERMMKKLRQSGEKVYAIGCIEEGRAPGERVVLE